MPTTKKLSEEHDMRFSERLGFVKVNKAIQKNSMNSELRNSLWNVLEFRIWKKHGYYNAARGTFNRHFNSLSNSLWLNFFKEPIHTIPSGHFLFLHFIREYYFKSEWNEIYDFIEYVAAHEDDEELYRDLNNILKKETSAYRFISGRLCPVVDDIEIESIEKSINETPFSSSSQHISSALLLISDRENPDYRNSIKESISAIESAAKEITGKKRATLGEALTVLEKNHSLPPALKKGFSAIYGYASNEDGIRHSLLESSNVSLEDALFFISICSAFTNYLKSKKYQ